MTVRERERIRERRRRKKRQMMIRRLTRLGVVALGAVLLVVFVVRGIVLPIMRSGDNGTDGNIVTENTEEEASQEDVETKTEENSIQAVRVPLKSAADTAKLGTMTPGWHDSADGRWYQNADGTFYADGFQEIDGTVYSFNDNGYIQTGWVTKESVDYYFEEDGSYNPEEKRKLLCLTFDDGPGKYTDDLLDCLEENGAHATFFMLGQNVPYYEDTVKRMVELGCEIGNHSYDHAQLTTLSLDNAASQFQRTDDALIQACGQASTVCRAPYGDGNMDIYATVGKPFVLWSLDSLDWKYKDADLDYNEVMNGDLTDGSIILMHDIHEASVESAKRMIPELVAQGYKLVTIHEMAASKNVTLQNNVYIDFWESALESGQVPGYNGNSDLSESLS